MDTQSTFHPGETVVYAMHGMGQVTAIVKRPDDIASPCFYQITLNGKASGKVLVPVASAQELGLRHALEAAEVPQVIQQLQHPIAPRLDQ